jgi:hypothetical protein
VSDASLNQTISPPCALAQQHTSLYFTEALHGDTLLLTISSETVCFLAKKAFE